jgi:hypothetical protein
MSARKHTEEEVSSAEETVREALVAGDDTRRVSNA